MVPNHDFLQNFLPFDLFERMKYYQRANHSSYHSPRCNTQIISGMQITIDSSIAIPNCAADARRAELLRTISCSPGIGAGPQQTENAQIRRSGNAHFSHMARHKHCLRLVSRQGLWPHMHCLPLLYQIWYKSSKQCICNTNAQNPPVSLSRNGWVSAC